MSLRGRTLTRAIRLWRILESGRRATLPQLAQELGCCPRTVRRDLAALEEAGLPICHDGYTGWGAGKWWVTR